MNDKIATLIHNVAAAVAAVAIGFWRAWDIFAVMLCAWPALILTGMVYAKIMDLLKQTTQRSQDDANVVALAILTFG